MPPTLQYPFWLFLISAACFTLERFHPWRRQKALRAQFAQDLFWLAFNGHFLGLLLGLGTSRIISGRAPLLGLGESGFFQNIALLAGQPFWLQFSAALVIRDFLEYLIHNLLHRVPWLWQFHKVHHSIVELDWIGNFRFHAVEGIVYKTLLYAPMAALGATDGVLQAMAVTSTVIGHLNHANLNISWGPLRYVVNSPRLHVWHHDMVQHFKGGQNFAVIFSAWDWIFRTAYMPPGQPERLGFAGMEAYPSSLAGRFFYPISVLFRR
jgi:sterol desaturase/sphingolipid hydroxylase (fatty acid hydroxylase superfamily)